MAMQARISTVEGDGGKIDDALKVINEKIMPALKGLKGFTAANFLADRSAGKLVVVAFWQDEAALEGSAEAVKPMRTEVAEVMNGKVVGLESYELVAQSW
jgi:heme-degrading monooxygenase HmoA